MTREATTVGPSQDWQTGANISDDATLGPRATARVSSVRAAVRWGSTAAPSSRARTSSGVSRGTSRTRTGAPRRRRGAASSPPGRSTPVVDARIRRSADAPGGRTARCPANPCANRSCAAASAGCTTARRSSSTRWPRPGPSFPTGPRTRTQTGRTHPRGTSRRTCDRCGISSRSTSGPSMAGGEETDPEEDRTGGRGRDPEKKRRRSLSARCGAFDAETPAPASLSPSDRADTSSATGPGGTRRRRRWRDAVSHRAVSHRIAPSATFASIATAASTSTPSTFQSARGCAQLSTRDARRRTTDGIGGV